MPDVIADVVRPAPPSMRFIPRGTALEINNHANAAAAPTLGTQQPRTACDLKLRPLAAAAPPSAAPFTVAGSRAHRGADRNRRRCPDRATAAPAPHSTPQRVCALLNSLFRLAELTRPRGGTITNSPVVSSRLPAAAEAAGNVRAQIAVSLRTDCRAGVRCRLPPTRSDNVIAPAPAISFRPCQNASSRLTLVLCPAMTMERLTTGDFIARLPFRSGAGLSLFAELVAPGLVEGSLGLRAAMRKPIGSGLLVGLMPFGLLARDAEIDDVAHAKSAIPKSASFSLLSRERSAPTR